MKIEEVTEPGFYWLEEIKTGEVVFAPIQFTGKIEDGDFYFYELGSRGQVIILQQEFPHFRLHKLIPPQKGEES